MAMNRLTVFVVMASVALPTLAVAQETQRSWNLPAELGAKQLSDEAWQAANGNVADILRTVSADPTQLTATTEGLILRSPQALPQVMNAVAQAATTQEAASIGLGLCMATSSLVGAANAPSAVPAQAQGARDFARAILQTVINASQSNARLGEAVSNSFGVAVNPNGSIGVTCKSLTGEVVATSAVEGTAPAGSNAGVGGAVSQNSDGTASAGNVEADSSGGGLRHVDYSGGASALLFEGAATDSVLQVPGPEAATGLIPLLMIAAYSARRRFARVFGR